MSAGGWAGSRSFRRPPPRRIGGDWCKGGGGGGQSAQATVDPTALGNAQLAANVGTAETQAALNNVSTFSPYGSTTYTGSNIDPATGKPSSYNVNQTLSPALSNLFGAQTGLAQAITGGYSPYLGATNALLDLSRTPLAYAGNMAASLPQGLDLSGIPQVGMLSPGSFQTNVVGGAGGQAIPNAVTGLPLQTSVVPQGVPALTQQAQDAAYQSQSQYLDPQFNQAEETLRQHLADQGIEEGSPAFSRAMGDFDRQKQMAYSNAGYNAVQAGNAQEQALFGQALAGGQFANQALLQGGTFTNQAQQQLFGQGVQLADLYNQAVLGAQGADVSAQQANLARAQAAFGAPWSAATNFANLGSSLYGLGLGTLGSALPGVTAWPTGPTAIPNAAPGAATQVSAANIIGAQQAATQQGQLANLARNQMWSGIGSLGNSLLSGNGLGGVLFGQGGASSLFGPGGLIGSLGGAAGAFPAISSGVAGAIGAPELAGLAPQAFTDAIMAMAL